MPSPFPGMNPYLERPAMWPDFHNAYVARLRAQLAGQVAPRYFARLQEQIYLRELPDGPRGYVPDVSLTGRPPPAPAGGAAVRAPATVRLPMPAVEKSRETFIEVVDRDGQRVVTVVELLSPANKLPGADRDRYLDKRYRLLRAGVGFVEMDLLRGGPRSAPGLPACDYAVLVARGPALPDADLWPVRLADPLPAVPVPLRPGDPEPTLDLQAALHAVYDEAGYRHFAYLGDPDPPLTPAQAGWAAGLLPQEGR